MSWGAIAGFRLVSHDPDRLVAFYAALGFVPAPAVPIAADEMAVLGLSARGTRRPLALGPSRLAIDAFDVPGAPYPTGVDGASTLFQHLALVTDDAAAAWARARAAGATPISRGGPVTLPASSGGVTAIKFRDPDGHPLEFLRFPASDRWRGRGILGIDHSAISVADVAASEAFYLGRGLARGDASLNRGPTQVALDGLDDVAVDVVPLIPMTATPHLELLGYRVPPAHRTDPPAVNDVTATRIVWDAGGPGLVRDPDGHLHQLT